MANAAIANLERDTPIVRRSLHDELVDRLRVLITEGELEPGHKVPEKALCERYGVSRTPMREALKVLAREELVELVPNRGATVTRLTVEDLDEVFPIMGVLEALAGELACRNIDEAGVAAIEEMHCEMVRCFEKRDLKGYFSSNQAIHEAISTAAGNPTLTSMQGSLAGRIRRARYLANMSDARWVEAVAEHEAMMVALREKNGQALGTILRTHLENKCATVKDAISRDGAGE